MARTQGTLVHEVIPSKDWMYQGPLAKCTCGRQRCSVLIERGELPPMPEPDWAKR